MKSYGSVNSQGRWACQTPDSYQLRSAHYPPLDNIFCAEKGIYSTMQSLLEYIRHFGSLPLRYFLVNIVIKDIYDNVKCNPIHVVDVTKVRVAIL
jgi:hypothetical protein